MPFEPFQKVLVRDAEGLQWTATFFSHERNLDGLTQYVCAGIVWEYCIPYEGNEHLLGTSDAPAKPEPVFAFGEHVEVSENNYDWNEAIYIDKAVRIGATTEKQTAYRVLHITGTVGLWKYCRKANW